MGLFDSDRNYGGIRLAEEFPLLEGPALDGEHIIGSKDKVLAQSEPFIVWECNGVVANIDTDNGPARKCEFVVSHSDPAVVKDRGKFVANTIGSAIADKVEKAGDTVNDDLPAVAVLQRIKSDDKGKNDANVLTLFCEFDKFGPAKAIARALADHARKSADDSIPF